MDPMGFRKCLRNMVIGKSPKLGLWDPFQLAERTMAYEWGGDPNHLQVMEWSSKYPLVN